MRLSQYPKTETLAANSYLITDHPSNGTKAVIPKDLMKNLLSFTDRDMFFDFLDEIATITLRRKIFRGKNLGDSITEEQNEAIKDGSFKGMFIGDYWEIGENYFVIYDMDYYRWSSKVPHHLVLSENKLIGKVVMKDSVTGVGFANTDIYQSTLSLYDQKIVGIFGDHCFVVPFLISSDIDGTNNYVTSTQNNGKVSTLMSEVNLYGFPSYSNLENNGAYVQSTLGQLSYFQLRNLMDINNVIWLRDYSFYNRGFFCIYQPSLGSSSCASQKSNAYFWPIFTIKGV